MTTTITDDHIRALYDEAVAHGDMEQAAACYAALEGPTLAWPDQDVARRACEEAIRDARAQDDS